MQYHCTGQLHDGLFHIVEGYMQARQALIKSAHKGRRDEEDGGTAKIKARRYFPVYISLVLDI